MTIPRIDNLTADETKTLATECLGLMTFDEILEVLQQVLPDDLQVEMALQLYPQIENDDDAA